MGPDGIRYFITPLFEDMDPLGRVRQVRAQTKHIPTNQNIRWGQQMQDKSQDPSTPPMSEMRITSNNNEINSQFQNVTLYHMHVTKIDYDHQYVVLYQNNVGMVFKTMSQHGSIYPPKLNLHVYGKNGMATFTTMSVRKI